MTLTTWNIRGLKSKNNVNKQKKVDKIITELKCVQSNMILNLQETHLEFESETPKEWLNFSHTYHILFSGAESLDKGAGIICFINKTEDILEWENVLPGRLVYAKIKNKNTEKVSNIFSIYGITNGAKDDKINMLIKLEEYFNKVSKDESLYVLGDFNFVTSKLDRNSSKYTPNDEIYRHKWNELEIKIGIMDCFRKCYKNRRLYTFTSGSHAKSRIDRIYVSNDASGKVEKMVFENSDLSDHKMVRLKLAKEVSRGPGNYIFNNTLLQDECFVNEIRELIGEFKRERDAYPSKKILWDFLKMGIASHANLYSMNKARKERNELENIRKNLEFLEATPKHRLTDEINNNIALLKKQEMLHLNKKIKGAILRTKIPHMEENDISISYISKLEKLKGEDNTIYSLKDQNDILQEGSEKVSKIAYDFYKDLYTKEPEDESLQDLFLDKVKTHLSEEEKAFLDMSLSKDELFKLLTDLKSNKSPGEDALTKDFFGMIPRSTQGNRELRGTY